jgi:hypothetical protein
MGVKAIQWFEGGQRKRLSQSRTASSSVAGDRLRHESPISFAGAALGTLTPLLKYRHLHRLVPLGDVAAWFAANPDDAKIE